MKDKEMFVLSETWGGIFPCCGSAPFRFLARSLLETGEMMKSVGLMYLEEVEEKAKAEAPISTTHMKKHEQTCTDESIESV